NEDIIQNMRTGIIVVDIAGHIRLANSSAEVLLGNISLQDNPLLENILPALDARFLQWLEQPNMHHKAIRQEHGLPDIQPGFRKLQRTEHEDTDSNGGGMGDTLIFLEDATRLNQRFQQIKLASLGRLTASIAHEIRNPLSAINHAAQLLDEGDLNPGDKKLSGIITTQVQRLDKVIENVLQLSRQQQGTIETLELNRWLQDFRDDFLQTNKLSKDQLRLDILLNEVTILFDSSHLTQVMCNLCTNAIVHNDKALEKIKIIIRCGHDNEFDQPFIAIIDNGPEIPDKIVQQIFDPFFTTSSKGTGLGLYITKEMVESNRGKIIYTKSGDKGNCFKLLFIGKNSQ
ncbi:MAG: ATP-binding protein, partial [Methylococcales bacterium]